MGSPFAMKHRRNPMAMALQQSSSLAPCEMPPVSTLRDQASNVGRLKKLSGKGILTSGTWRERFCLLVKNKLYYYESEESVGGTDKSCGFVNLEYFDTCTEASTRMARKATNVFVIGASDKGFFESHSGRHYFAAETLPEMKEWVNAINSAMKNHIRKEKRTGRDGSLTPGQNKRDNSSTKMKSKTQQPDSSQSGSLPRTEAALDHVTKSRARGPQGRRLPRKPQRGSNHNNGGGGIQDSKTDSVLDSEEEATMIPSSTQVVQLKDSRGRATSLSALEATSESHSKISINMTDDTRIGIEAWDKTETREELETPDIELIYDYSSSDSNEGSVGQLGSVSMKATISGGGYIQRRPLSRAGSHNRNSSVTPPPCVLRKNRREQENNNSQKTVPPSSEFGTLHRASSGSCSSLSTLTADTYADISNLNGGPFLSLQRKKDKKLNDNGFNNGSYKQFHVPTPSNMNNNNNKPPIFQHHHHQRQSSSVHGSPLMNNGGGGHLHGVMLHNNPHIARNGYSSHNSSPNNTFDRNNTAYLCNNGAAPANNTSTNGFQLERSLFSLNKDLESITQETKQLDADVTGLRQDVGTIQENIVTVRGAVNGTQDKITRLQNHVNYVEKQVASIIKEASSLKEQAREMLDSAKNAQELQTNLLEEAQALVSFLKQSTSPTCIPPHASSSPYNNNIMHHQHYNGHFTPQTSSCCTTSSPCGTPVPQPYFVHPPSQSSSPIQLSLRRRGKTPERSKAVDEADMDTLNELVVTGGGAAQQTGCYDSIRTRNCKSAMSNSSSCSGGSNNSSSGNGNASSNKRASVIDPLVEQRKLVVGTRSPIIITNGKAGECTKVSHL